MTIKEHNSVRSFHSSLNFKASLKIILTVHCLLEFACATKPQSQIPGKFDAPKVLADLTAIDSSNPPGNESEVVKYIANLLKEQKIPYEVLQEVGTHRPNIVARVRGDGSQKPILLVSHLDVVPANPQAWQTPPFQLTIKDKRYYGRGVADMKGILAAQLNALIVANNQSSTLKRDVIFAGVADEESGSHFGMQFLLKHFRDRLDSEYAFTEGGGGRLFFSEGVPLFAGFQISERSVLNIKITASGLAGHAMYGMNQNSIIRLSKVLEKLSNFKIPEAEEKLFTNFKNHVIRLIGQKSYINLITNHSELSNFIHSMSHSTIAPTILSAGASNNVAPGEAFAVLDCRLLPSVDREAFLNRLKIFLKAENVNIEAIPNTEPNSHVSLLNSLLEKTYSVALNEVLGRKIAIIPSIGAGATDSRFLRDANIQSYGIFPFPDSGSFNTHGNDESLSVGGFESGVEIYKRFILRLAVND